MGEYSNSYFSKMWKLIKNKEDTEFDTQFN